MTIHDTFAGAQYTSEIAGIVERVGMELRLGDDFEVYSDIIAAHRPEQPIGEPFDPEHTEINGKNGFWLTGWNRDGELVHTQAIRRLRLGGTLADYLSSQFRKYPPPGMEIDFSRSRYRPGPGARRISGTACYHGEAWIKPGDATFRGTGIIGPLARFTMASALLRWSPDFIFGFISEGLAYRGLVEREGYMHTDPGALAWKLPEGETLHGFMCWMSREDMDHMMEMSVERLVA